MDTTSCISEKFHMSKDLVPKASPGFRVSFQDVRVEMGLNVCGWCPWRHPGLEHTPWGLQNPHSSSVAINNPEAGVPGVTLRAFWKHPPYLFRDSRPKVEKQEEEITEGSPDKTSQGPAASAHSGHRRGTDTKAQEGSNLVKETYPRTSSCPLRMPQSSDSARRM